MKLLEQIKKSKIDNRFFFILVFDLLFVFVSFLLFSLIGISLDKVLGSVVGNMGLDVTKYEGNIGLINQDMSAISEVYGILLFAFVLTLIVFFLLNSLFNYIIWATAYDKEFKQKDAKLVVRTHFLYSLIWIPLFLLSLTMFIGPYVAIVTLITIALYLHYGTILISLTLFKPEKKLIRQTFAIGTEKIGIFILPYLTLGIIFIIFRLIITGPLLACIFILLLAWSRILISTVIKSNKMI